jgi:hypothetical protein
MRILLAKTPTSSLSIGPRSRPAAKKRNELPPELRGRATIVRRSGQCLNRIFRRAARSLARFVELGGGLS